MTELRLTEATKHYMGIKANEKTVSYLEAAIYWGKAAKKMCTTQSYIASGQSPVHIFTGKVDTFLNEAGSELTLSDSDPFYNYSDIYALNKDLKSKLEVTTLSSQFESIVDDLLSELKDTLKNL